MNPAVALVQAYLRVNGYFTVTEYPLFEEAAGGVRTVTDLDVLAFRFPRVAGAASASAARGRAIRGVQNPDPLLAGDPDRPDMILAEVKEGTPRFNEASLHPRVLGAGLARFGCCSPEEGEGLARSLLRNGSAESSHGHSIRAVAFGSGEGLGSQGRRRPYHVVSLRHVVEFLQDYLSEEWGVLRHVQLLEPGLSVLHVLMKAGVAPRT